MDKIAISISEAAKQLGVSRPTMYAIARRADFDAVFKVGSRTLVYREKLEKWVVRQTEVNEKGC